jgi:hypothetical protein
MPKNSRSGAEGLREDLVQQRRLMGKRVPSYNALLDELGRIAEPNGALCRELARVWQSRKFESFYERPLLLLACLRHDALLEGPTHPLYGAVARTQPDPEDVTPERVQKALAEDRLGLWTSLRTRRVQTNEVSRSVTWLWPAAIGGALEGRPLVIADIGASAGLNLVADHLTLAWIDTDGNRVPVAHDANVLSRVGFDARPLNALDPEDVRWLRACVWPGESERLEALDNAIEEFVRAVPSVEMQRHSASAAALRLKQMLVPLEHGALMIVVQTLVADYLAIRERELYERSMLDLISTAREGHVLWTSLELAEESSTMPAEIAVRFRRGASVQKLVLARTNYHPVTLEIDREAVAELADALSWS